MIPNGWREATAEELCSRISVGIVIKPAQYYVDEGQGVRAFRSANIGEGFVRDSDWVSISEEGHTKNKKSALKANDILIVRTGYPGTACLLPVEYEGSNCIDIIFARPDQDQVVPAYLCTFTNSEYGKKQVIDGSGGLAQQHFNVGAYKKLKLPLPPLSEQRQIAETLDAWDRAIETVKALIANTRAQKQALMQQLLPKGTTLPKKRLPGFSGEWREIRLGEAFTERVERGDDRMPLLSVTQANGVIPQEDAGRRNISSEDQSNYKTVCTGDIAYNTMRMWQGASALSALTGKVSPAYTVVAPRKGHDALFYAYLFKQPKMIHVFERHSQGLVSDTWNLKFPHFAKIRTCVPGIEEQRAIAAAFQSLDKLMFAYATQLTALRQEKAALMQQLLTGKRRVKLDRKEAA